MFAGARARYPAGHVQGSLPGHAHDARQHALAWLRRTGLAVNCWSYGAQGMVVSSTMSLGARVFLFLVLLVAAPAAALAVVSGDFAGLVDIGGGRKMYLECRDTGFPTVVLVAGLKGSAEDWNSTKQSEPTVFAGVATFTRVCAYDRPGTPVGEKPSRSDPVSQPTTAADAVADLHDLLSAAGEAGPCACRALVWRSGRQALCEHLSRRRIRSRPRRRSRRRASKCGDA